MYITKQSYPKLMILGGKHGNTFFHLKDNEDLKKALCTVFKINSDNGYYYFETEETYQSKLTELKAKFEKMSDPQFADIIDVHKLHSLKRDYRRTQYEMEEAKQYEKAVSGDVEAKCQFVWNRTSSEYEGISFEDYREI